MPYDEPIEKLKYEENISSTIETKNLIIPAETQHERPIALGSVEVQAREYLAETIVQLHKYEKMPLMA